MVLSDSQINADFKEKVSFLFQRALFLDQIDAVESHEIMRFSRVLICSNSTFSLTAAMLNKQALIVLPKQWYGDKSRTIELPINSRCVFQLMS